MNKLKKSMSVLLTLVMLFTTLCFFVIPEAKVEANAAETAYKYKIALSPDLNATVVNLQYSRAYLRIKSNNGAGSDVKTITLGEYGDGDGKSFGKTDVTYEGTVPAEYAGYFPYELYVVYKARFTADIDVSCKIYIYDYSSSSYKEAKSATFDMNGSSQLLDKNQEERNRTVSLNGTWYPAVQNGAGKVSVSGDSTVCIPASGASVSQQVTIGAVDQYGVAWVNAPTVTLSDTTNCSIANGNSKTPTITYKNALTDYSTNLQMSWSTGNTSYSTVSYSTSRNVKVTRTMAFDNYFDFGAWRRAGIKGASVAISGITDTGFTITSNSDSNGSAYTEFNYYLPIAPGDYILTVDAESSVKFRAGVAIYPSNYDGLDPWGYSSLKWNDGTSDPDNWLDPSTKQLVCAFTVPENCGYISVRVDPGARATLNVSNFRIVKSDYAIDEINLNTTGMSISYADKFSAYNGKVPIPTRLGYNFTGWYWQDSLCYDASGTWVLAGNLDYSVKTYSDALGYFVNLNSQWELANYAINFNLNDGTGVTNTINYTILDTSVTIPTATRDGYTFNGWEVTTAEGAWVLNNTYNPGELALSRQHGNVTLTAQWTLNKYSINFNSDGNETLNSIEYDVEDTSVALPTPTKTGYTFSKWIVETADGNWTVGEDVIASLSRKYGNITIKPVWTVNQYTITFDTDGGSSVAPITQDFGTAVTAPADPTKEGYTFLGWDTEIPANMPAKDMTIKASWKINQYTITFDTDGGSEIAPITQNYNTAVTAPAAPTKEGYTFAGWDTEIPANMPAKDMTIKAKWNVNQYTITYVKGNGEENIVDTYDFGETVTAPADPTRTGYTFDGWDVSVPATMPAKDMTLTAKWNVNQYTITYVKGNGEENIVDTYDFGATVTAPADPTRIGYTFDGWDAQIPATMPAENLTINAQWTLNGYTVTFVFMNAEGEENSVSRYEVSHGTAFSDLSFPTEAEGFAQVHYKAGDLVSHYNFTDWDNKNTVTGPVTINATYIAQGHTFVDFAGADVYKEPTCTEDGYQDKICTACSFTYREVLPAGHNFVNPVDYKAPTCTEDGNEAYKYCNNGCEKYYAADATETTPISEGKAKSAFTIPASHTLGELIPATPATCEGTGTKAHYYCSVCEKNIDTDKKTVIDIVIPANGHDYGEWNKEVPATCEGTGTLGHYQCSVEGCKKYFDAQKNELSSLVIEAKGHEYGTLIPEVPATCVATGTKAYYDCANCDKNFDADKNELDSLVLDINPDNHDLETVPGQLPTCEGIGWDAYQRCKRDGCNHSTYVEKPALEHNYVGKVTTDVTCITNGVTTYTCTNDASHTYTEAIVAVGHQFTNHVAYKAPECLVDGHKAYKQCSVCLMYFAEAEDTFSADAHDSEADFVLSKSGHTEATRQEITVHATCQVQGDYKIITYCSVCTETLKTEEFEGEYLPHNYSVETKNYPRTSATCVDYATYYLACTMCSRSSENDGNAYYEDEAADLNATNHTTAETHTVNYVDSTCYAVGYTGDKLYNCCDALYEKGTEIAKKEHTPAEAVVENKIDSTCYAEGSYNEVVYCSVSECGEKLSSTAKTIAKKEHTPAEPVSENIVDSTCYAEGSYNEVVYCSVSECHEKLSSTAKTIEKKAHTPADAVRENVVDSTCYAEGSYDSVVYCSVEACKFEISRTEKTIEKKAHTPADAVRENVVDSTCYAEGSYDSVVYCSVEACKFEISRTEKTIEKKAHTPADAVRENVVDSTCYAEGSYDSVVYCSVAECKHEINRTAKTIEKKAHTPAEAVTENVVAPKCEENGSHDEVVYCSVCEAAGKKTELSRETVVDAMTGHIEGEAVVENNVPPTDTADGHYDSVVYCTSCNKELSRTTVQVRPEREITFVLYGETVVIKAQLGDTVTAPTVPDYTDSTGFVHKFKAWDKPITAVTGKTTYTAVYTEPCNWSNVDSLEKTLNEILKGGVVEDSVLEENKAQIEAVLKQLEELKKDRNTLDKSEQAKVDYVATQIGSLIDVIYPDAGSTLVIQGASTAYVGTILDLKAVKMPLGTVVTDAIWVSSDENVVFFANGKLYAIGTGTVTITATRGILKASKTVTIIQGGNTRGINFTSIDKTHFIIEDYRAVYDADIIYWSDDFDLRFRVKVYQNFMFDDYIVYINGEEAEPDENGYYVVPAGSGDAKVTIAGAMVDITDDGNGGQTVTKWSFWEWLLSFFRKIADFFKGIGK